MVKPVDNELSSTDDVMKASRSAWFSQKCDTRRERTVLKKRFFLCLNGPKARRVALAVVICVIGIPLNAHKILFVGNSFTFGAGSAVRKYHVDQVTDRNGDGIGGVPALFKLFTKEAGLHWAVSLETAPGTDLAFHYKQRRRQLAGAWNVVVLQGHSMLNAAKPGDASEHVRMATLLAAMFKCANPKTQIFIESTWSRADQVFPSKGHWYGKPIGAMADDLARANTVAMRSSRDIADTIPVGTAWSRAMHDGVADPNPYDGIDFGKIDLWTWDHYHASSAGYYLAALVIFGRVTKIDPRTLGAAEIAGDELGLEPQLVVRLQSTAADELAAAL